MDDIEKEGDGGVVEVAESVAEEIVGDVADKNKINQSQFYELITSDELSWQAIIYDLVKTEQLDPWNIDLGILADKYIETIEEFEETNFFVSSKVLLACSLLLRLKSEILLNYYISDLDEILYGKKEQKNYEYERIEIDEDELPILVPKTPMARHRKVTLNELIGALSQAIDTENKRIKKEIRHFQSKKNALIVLPKKNRISLKNKTKNLYQRIHDFLKHPEKVEMKFSDLAPTKEEKLSSFIPILHLTNQERLYLKQEQHFDEIFMMLDKMEEEIEELRENVEEVKEELDEEIDELSDEENLNEKIN